MSDSTDNTNDLDSYGVWVKRPPQDSSDEADTLPDFSDFDIPEETSSQDGIDIPEVADTPDLAQFESDSSLSEAEVSDISFDNSTPKKSNNPATISAHAGALGLTKL